jgi:thiol-disulfide isomerase/thioredoxin
VQLGDAAPVIELDDLSHDRVSLEPLRGRVVVVQFFATWCGPCHRAFEDLMAVRQDPRLAPAQIPAVLLIDLEESSEMVRRWASAARLDPAITVALDRNATAAARWGANRLPTVFVLDAKGIVRHINRGWGDGYRDRLRRWLSAPPPKPR